MGANASKSIENVSNKIITNLEQNAGASSVANCSVVTGNIILRRSNQCTVNNQNRCTSNANAAIDAISKAATDAFLQASNEQKTSLIPGINVNESAQTIETIIKNRLTQQCQANSSLTQEIATKDLILEECTNSVINNINAGSSQANCAVQTVLNTIIQADAVQKNNQSTGDIFGSLGQIGSTMSYICISLILLCMISSIVLFFLMRR